MARINVEKIIERLEYELKSSLKSALNSVAPDNKIDFQALFKEFRKQVNRNCKQWEQVENSAVDVD